MHKSPKLFIEAVFRASDVLILAPHGGNIEVGTTEIASFLAGDRYSFYSLSAPNHKPSHLFDEPRCVELVQKSLLVIAIHGMRENSEKIVIWGLYDSELLIDRLRESGFEAESAERYPLLAGVHPNNICNRGILKRGVQIEVATRMRDRLMRESGMRERFKKVVDVFIAHALQKSRS